MFCRFPVFWRRAAAQGSRLALLQALYAGDGYGGDRFILVGLGGRDASEGKGPQRRSQKRLGRRLEEVAKAVGGGYCRLQMPLRPALGVRGTVGGHRLGALEGGTSPPSNASLGGEGGQGPCSAPVPVQTQLGRSIHGCPVSRPAGLLTAPVPHGGTGGREMPPCLCAVWECAERALGPRPTATPGRGALGACFQDPPTPPLIRLQGPGPPQAPQDV